MFYLSLLICIFIAEIRELFWDIILKITFKRKGLLPIQLGGTGGCESPGSVQMHNPGRVHDRYSGNYAILNESKF